MEEQMQKERVEATKTSKHQLRSIMSELCAFKKKHKKDTKERKVDEKALLENIKASIDPILKSDHKTSDHIGRRHSTKTSSRRSHQLLTANCK